MPFYSTLQAAEKLGLSAGQLLRAVWLRRIPPPSKGPGGAYFWEEADLRRACSYFLHRPLEAVLSERAGRGEPSPGVVR